MVFERAGSRGDPERANISVDLGTKTGSNGPVEKVSAKRGKNEVWRGGGRQKSACVYWIDP